MIMDYRMTIGQVRKACKGKKYILLWDAYKGWTGVNTYILNMSKIKSKHGNMKSRFISFKDCDIQEYITHKIPIS